MNGEFDVRRHPKQRFSNRGGSVPVLVVPRLGSQRVTGIREVAHSPTSVRRQRHADEDFHVNHVPIPLDTTLRPRKRLYENRGRGPHSSRGLRHVLSREDSLGEGDSSRPRRNRSGRHRIVKTISFVAHGEIDGKHLSKIQRRIECDNTTTRRI